MYKTVLVAIDVEHGEHNRQILGVAKGIADLDGADIHLLAVVAAAPAIVSQFLHENYEQMASGQATQALADLAAELGFDKGKVSTSIRFGTIYEEILTAAEAIGADLIVTGSHKPNVSDYLLGSNAARVVRHADCSVLVVR
jgi:nucleotide-binding universal stress UspA family protein